MSTEPFKTPTTRAMGINMADNRNSSPTMRPEIAPRRRVDLPGLAPRGPEPAPEPPATEGKKLLVGRDIFLTGEITACNKLVIEGRVEASLAESQSIEITNTGHFKGTAEAETADISGNFEGKLLVRKRLVIRATGRVTGEIRYGEIEIESGGVISGDIRTIAETGESEKTGQTEDAPGSTPASLEHG